MIILFGVISSGFLIYLLGVPIIIVLRDRRKSKLDESFNEAKYKDLF